jgi:hypothetical protein
MGLLYPRVETLRQTMKTLKELEKVSFAIGDDGRNRYLGGLCGVSAQGAHGATARV